jgi:hypothetical protein
MLPTSLRCVLAISLLAWGGGCVRAGFGPAASPGEGVAKGDGLARGDGLAKGDAPAVPLDGIRFLAVGAANDTCASAAALGPLGGPALVTVGTAGATANYTDPSCCAGGVDVVLSFTLSVPSTVFFTCQGSGELVFIGNLDTTVAAPCPPTATGCFNVQCHAPDSGGAVSGSAHTFAAGTNYLVICRDPALPPATLVMAKTP